MQSLRGLLNEYCQYCYDVWWLLTDAFSVIAVPEAVEGELRILNMDFQTALADHKSWIYQYTSNDLAVYVSKFRLQIKKLQCLNPQQLSKLEQKYWYY